MTNMLNTVETNMLTFLSADTSLDALVTTFHAKLKMDQRTYSDHEVPAIGVYSQAISTNDDDHRHENLVKLYVEVTDYGGTISTVDDSVKQIADLVMRKLRDESPYRGGNGLSSSVRDIIVRSCQIVPFAITNGWMVSASVEVDCLVIE